MEIRQGIGLLFVLVGIIGCVPAFFYRNDIWFGIFVSMAIIGAIILASGFKLEREV